MAKHIARHRIAPKSHALRNTGIAAAAGAVVLGSVAPANAFAQASTVDAPAASSASQNFSATLDNAAAAPTTVETSSYQATPYSGGGSASGAAASTDTHNLSASRAKIVETALSGQGGSYVWGGRSFKAWDCSGFVSYVYQQNGINLTAYTHAMQGEVKSTANPQPGDIVFTNGYEHVGIYLGNGKMISALNPGQGTQITAVDGGGMMPVDGYYTAL